MYTIALKAEERVLGVDEMLIMKDIRIVIVIITLIIIGIIGAFTSKHVKSSKDYSVSGQSAGVLVLVGMLMSIIGGSATVGTAQMAFEYGISGWGFCLGGGMACLLMGIFYAGPLRRSNAETVPQFVGIVYGQSARMIIGIVSLIALFIQIIVQILTFIAIITELLNIDPFIAMCIASAFMIIYVFFGGSWGAGIVGIIKSVMIYFTLIIAGIAAYRLCGGVNGLKEVFPSFPWFQLFGRGFWKDGYGIISVIVGLLSTQTYIQVMFSGKSIVTCRKAAYISAVLIPPVGLACVLIGMYMRMSNPGTESIKVLPAFILQYLSPVNAGLAIAALLLAVIGTGAGMGLGMSVIVVKDIYSRLLRKNAKDRELLIVSRLSVIGILLSALVFIKGNLGTMILSWSYFSMGIRSSAIFFPLVLALVTIKKIPAWVGILGTTLGPSAILLCIIFWPDLLEPSFIGLLVSGIVLVISIFICKFTNERNGIGLKN
jgi:SSS family solute:Na+ symporter